MVSGPHVAASAASRRYDDAENYVTYSNINGSGQHSASVSRQVLQGRSPGMFGIAVRRFSTTDGTSTPASWYYSVPESRSGYGSNTPLSDAPYEHEVILRSYFHGQLADVMRRSIWWTIMGLLMAELMQRNNAITTSRTVFNTSLLFASLFSDLIAESMTIRKLLCLTLLWRLAIWTILLPASYCFFNFYLPLPGVFSWWCLLAVVLDGFQEALSNTSDLVYKGIDRLSHHYDMAIDPARHSMMLNKYQIASLVSFVCVVIPLSLIAYGLKFVVNKSELFILATVMGSAFAVLSAVSLYYYCSGLGYAAPADYTMHYGSVELSVVSAWDEMCCKLDDIKEGMLLACSSGSLMRQIFFVSMETAFEHSLICFCVPLTALDRTLFPDRGILHSAIICSLLVSAGKFGGSVYGLYAALCPPRNSRDVVPIRMTKVYRCLLMSCLSLVALSICSYANDGDPYSTMVQMMVVGALIFTFFAFSAYPKAVVSSIMNVAILSHPLSYKIFDFVNTFAVICDIVLTIALTVFMNKAVGTVGINGTVVSVTVFYIFHTLYHVLIGIRPSDVSPESRLHSPHVPYGPPLGRL